MSKKKRIKNNKNKNNFLRGIVDHVNKKYCFVTVEGLSEDIKISSRRMNGAIHGDEVEIKILHHLTRRNIEGEIIKIVSRKTNHFIGRIEDSRDFAFFIPKNKKIFTDFFINKKRSENFSNNKRYMVRVTDWETKKKPEAKVIKCLGKIGDNETEINSIIHDFNLPIKFSDEVIKETEQLNDKISDKEIKKRRDLRKLTTFTIDPDDAKDFDDALSIEFKGNHFLIGIHIADVSHFFNSRTKLNEEAENRATSVYLVDRTIPMLPEKLSNNLCSLKPNEDRLTFSVIIKINDKLEIIDRWIGKTVIHSDKRFTYEEAQISIDKREGPFAKSLIKLNSIAQKIRKERFENGSFNFRSEEIKFKLDNDKKPLEIFKKEKKDTHKMVEEYMLLANKIVAEKINSLSKRNNKNYTFVYRIHEDPKKEKIVELQNFIKQFGYSINSNEKNLSNSLNDLMKKIKGKPEESTIEKFAIRSMSKAKYSTNKENHFGLAFNNYTHFTSPIRRFPDIMVHRLISDYLNGSKPKEKLYYNILCKHCSKMEINATKAERESIKYKQTEYMSKFKGQIFDAVITGITEWGIYAEVIETKGEGLIKISSLKDDIYFYDDKKVRIVGKKYKKNYRLGKMISVKVADTNIDKRTIDLELL